MTATGVATATSATTAGVQRAAGRLPSWMGSIRFRLAVVYSSVLFGLAALMLSVVYIALAVQLNNQTVHQDQHVAFVTQTPDGQFVVRTGTAPVEVRTFEQEVNSAALYQLRRFSFGALFLLFLASLVIGWFVAGSALAPVERITLVAREIEATDLSRRINLGGPPDELRDLADTFDSMLGRIDGAFEEQKRFIHEASHELRNPLAVIRTNVDVTLADPAATPDDLRETLGVVQRSSERMTRLVDDLLVHARQGESVHQMMPVELGALVADAVGEFRVPAEERGLRLEVAGVDGPDRTVIGDPVALKQAITNLLANAVRLAPAGSTVRASVGAEGAWVWMAVADEGPGIAPEDQDRVFQRFFRGPQSKGSGQGSGLGLTIVRQIAESHCGEVRLVSEPGRGSVFAVWLPPAAPPTAEATDPLATSENEPAPSRPF